MIQLYFIFEKQDVELLKSTFVVGCSYVCTIVFHIGCISLCNNI
jgi:hypothetical protein